MLFLALGIVPDQIRVSISSTHETGLNPEAFLHLSFLAKLDTRKMLETYAQRNAAKTHMVTSGKSPILYKSLRRLP